MELSKKRRNLGSFTGKSTWRKGRREDGKRLRVNWKSKLWPSLIHISRPNRQTICSSSGVKRLVTTNKRRVHTRRTILSSILSTVVIPQRSRYLFYLKLIKVMTTNFVTTQCRCWANFYLFIYFLGGQLGRAKPWENPGKFLKFSFLKLIKFNQIINWVAHTYWKLIYSYFFPSTITGGPGPSPSYGTATNYFVFVLNAVN